MYVFLSPAGAVGPGTGDIATPPVRLSVRPSRLVFALYLKNSLLYFLKTLQVRAPSHGGFMLFATCKKKFGVDKNFGGGGGGGVVKIYFFFLISRFMLFSTLIKKNNIEKCPFTY